MRREVSKIMSNKQKDLKIPSCLDRRSSNALEELRRQALDEQSIVIKPTDKNLGPAIISTRWYKSECLRHLRDDSTYRRLDIMENPSISVKRKNTNMIQKVKHLLETLNSRRDKHKDMLSWVLKFLESKSKLAQIPSFYILPKVHKPTTVGRPIAAGHSWLTTPWSSILCHWLQPILTELPTVLKDSTTLLLTLEDMKLDPRKESTLITADVTSLYPSLDIKQVIETTTTMAENVYKNTWPQEMIDLLKNILYYVLRNSYVSFDGNTYLQKKGLAMGTPSAPMLANIVLAHYEIQFLKVNPRFTLFRRYIDDIFCIYTGTPQDAKRDLKSLYTELNIEITENVSRKEVEFLDLVIHKERRWFSQGILDIRTHQKALNRYMYLPFKSAHPRHSKIGFITAELMRYVRTCSNASQFAIIRKNSFTDCSNEDTQHSSSTLASPE